MGLSKHDAAMAGGKGASLGEMSQAGIPVPPGFVVLTQAFEKFIRDTDIAVEIDAVMHTVRHNEIHTVDDASEKIKALIMRAEMPTAVAEEIRQEFKKLGAQYVAVRSSATAEDSAAAAWAGQLESYLNTTEAELLENVKKCWASLFTPRAIFYRFEKFGVNTHLQKISVAVVVQKMVESEISGIAFSVHPVTQDYNQLIIEAGLGLGEAIVSGQITPDSYVVEKSPRRILDKNIVTQTRGMFRAAGGGSEWREVPKEHGEPPALTDTQILDLSELILKIESHYGFPCDIEWAYEATKFYIVQSRPITTLSPQNTPVLRDEIRKVFEEKKPFHRSVSYPKIPLIYVEASFDSYIDNPFYVEADTKPEPCGIMFMDTEFSYWSHVGSMPVISNIRSIEKIEEDTVSHILEFKQRLKRTLDTAQEKITKPAFIIDTLHETNKISVGIYRRFGLFIDESLHVADPSKIQRLQEVRMMLDDLVANYLFKVYDKIISVLTKSFGFDEGVIKNATTAEILELVNGRAKDIDLIKNRAIAYILFRNKIIVAHNEEARKIDAFLRKQDPDKVLVADAKNKKELRGLTGNPGQARGKVRKIMAPDYHNKEKLESLLDEEHFVLVTPMTAPELVPYFKNAVAFVTDEGGITCHAAIISRELRKPCITGTRIATQLLWDDDIVEVDADKGVVRILERDGKSTADYNPQDYVRMFAQKSFPYLFSNIFLGYYNSLGVISVTGENNWISFFPKALVARTNQEGKELYTSKETYQKYKQEFDNYLKESEEYFKSSLRKEKLSGVDVKKFFEQVSHLFVYYSKTEFFYTDGVKPDEMAITIKEFDDLKLGGRAYLNSLFFEIGGYGKSFIRKIAEQSGVPESDLLNYGVSELEKLVASGEKLTPDEINRRHTFFESKDKTLFGSEAKPLIDKFFADYLGTADIIKGTIANKGKARGKARVLIPDAKDFDKIIHAVKEMKEGEILVAETTSPDIIAACNKAAAIITNQGGQLSHAAIVSRELGIPCIIGTDKDVILNIKTGDLLEVDAINGVVKIMR